MKRRSFALLFSAFLPLHLLPFLLEAVAANEGEPLLCGIPRSGNLEPAGMRIHRFSLGEGESISVSVGDSSRQTDIRADLLDAAGNVLQTGIDPLYPRFGKVVPDLAPGNYAVRLRNDGSGLRPYTVELNILNPADSRPEECRAEISCAEPVTGNLDTLEHDLVRFRLEETERVTVAVRETSSRGGLGTDLLDASGHVMENDLVPPIPLTLSPGIYTVRIHNLRIEPRSYALTLYCSGFRRGDCNGDGEVSGETGDTLVLLNFLFLAGPPPPCVAACDTNVDANLDLSDAVYLLNFLFLDGPPPADFPQCVDPIDAVLDCERGACRP